MVIRLLEKYEKGIPMGGSSCATTQTRAAERSYSPLERPTHIRKIRLLILI